MQSLLVLNAICRLGQLQWNLCQFAMRLYDPATGRRQDLGRNDRVFGLLCFPVNTHVAVGLNRNLAIT